LRVLQCDTEDLSDDAENSAFITGNKLHFTIYSHRKKAVLNCNNIFFVLNFVVFVFLIK